MGGRREPSENSSDGQQVVRKPKGQPGKHNVVSLKTEESLKRNYRKDRFTERPKCPSVLTMKGLLNLIVEY